jgi:hypothetical protein
MDERGTDLSPRGGITRRRFGLHGDTAVAPNGESDRERDQLAVEMGRLFGQSDILQQRVTARPGSQDVEIVRGRRT